MEILNCKVNKVSMQSALDFIARAIQQPGDCCKQIITLNAEGIYIAQKDAVFRAIINNAALVTADGIGVLWAAKKLGSPLPERVTGIDLLQEACRLAADQGWRIYLLGAAKGIVDQAAVKFQASYPGLQIVGTHHGYFRGQEAAIIKKINQAQPNLLLVAMGMPFQEKFISSHLAELNAAVAIGVGGSFDVIAGNIKRAPRLMQRLGLEWFWRLLLQPSRLPRILVLPKFMWLVSKQARLEKT